MRDVRCQGAPGSFLEPLRAPPPGPEGRTACNGCRTRPAAAFPIEHDSAEGRRSLKRRALAAWLMRPAERHLFELEMNPDARPRQVASPACGRGRVREADRVRANAALPLTGIPDAPQARSGTQEGFPPSVPGSRLSAELTPDLIRGSGRDDRGGRSSLAAADRPELASGKQL